MSRDFSSGQFPNSYRQPPSGPRDRSSHWDPVRRDSSRGPPGDYDRDRDRGFYDRNRDRDRRQEPRDREHIRRDSDTNRPPPRPQLQSPKMSSDKASAEVAKGLRAVCEIMAQKVQLSYKKDIEIKASKKREQDYNNKISGAKQFPAVRELHAKNHKHHQDILDPINKKLADVEKILQDKTENFAETLVKALPINEVKTRQVIDAAKRELSRETKSSSAQPAQGDRFQKLEELVVSLKEKQDAQDRELDSLKRLNDKLRTGESNAIALKNERDQFQSENKLLKTELETLAERVGIVEAWKTEYLKTVDSRWGDCSKSMEQVNAECSSITKRINSTEEQANITFQRIEALGEKDNALSEDIAALKKYVDGHEDLLANVDIENLDDTIAKVQEYPPYSTFDQRVTLQATDVGSLKDSLHNTKQELEKGLAETFERFSNKIIEYCGQKFDGFEGRVKMLEAAKSSADVNSSPRAYPPQAGSSTPGSASAGGPEVASVHQGISDAAESLLATATSGANATEKTIGTLHSKTEALQDEIVAVKDQIVNRCGALEMMVESLDDQWKNLNTTQMAQYMLEHLSRLQPSQLTPELRQLHIRLSDVEKSVHDEKQERRAIRDRVRSSYDDMADPGEKRVYAEGDAFHRQKRARHEGMNSVNRVTNGNPHP